MSEWALQATIRVTLLLGGVVCAWRWVPVVDPALRRRMILVASGLALAAPWLAGWWRFGEAAAAVSPAGTFGALRWLGEAFAAMWFAGGAIGIVRLARQSIGLRSVIERAQPFEFPDGAVATLTCSCSARPPFRIRVSGEISGPCVAGIWRPVLLVPSAARHWPRDHWEMVLAHEAQHVRQCDLIAAWLPRLVLAVYWWHPLAHWLVRQFHMESEALCDRAVVGESHSARDYVELLLAFDGTRVPGIAAPMARASSLGHRIERIIFFSRRRPAPAAVTLALGLMAVISGLALSLRTRSLPSTNPRVSGDLSAEAALRLSASPFPGDR